MRRFTVSRPPLTPVAVTAGLLLLLSAALPLVAVGQSEVPPSQTLLPPDPSSTSSPPEFMLDFETLAQQIPDIVGGPIEDAHWVLSGDAVQATTTGLLVWRKADRRTAFTDGTRTWIVGPYGLESRLNSTRFDWERGLVSSADSLAGAAVLGAPAVETQCRRFPSGGFGDVWYRHRDVRDYLGCPTSATVQEVSDFAAQRFEGGVMLWGARGFGSDDFGLVLVLFDDDGSFQRIIDNWQSLLQEPASLVPPPGRVEPTGRFGKVWREIPAVQQRLGWALEPEKRGGAGNPDPSRSLSGASLAFDRGHMYWIPYKAGTPSYTMDRVIYVLASSGPFAGRWLSFADISPE